MRKLYKLKNYKYKAFISYKHLELGLEQAKALEAALKNYAKPLLKPPLRIFRDEQHIVPNSNLSNLVKQGLQSSEYLIFLAEAEAAQSKWCSDELLFWCRDLERTSHLIIVHLDNDITINKTDGSIIWEETDALPTVIKGYLSHPPPIFDLTWAKYKKTLDLQHSQYRQVINEITAIIHEIAPKELRKRHFKVMRTNKRIILSTISILLVALLFVIYASCNAISKTKLANHNIQIAEYNTIKTNESLKLSHKQIALTTAEIKRAQLAKIKSDSIKEVAMEKRELAKFSLKEYQKKLAEFYISEAWKKLEENSLMALYLSQEAEQLSPRSATAIMDTLPSYLSINFGQSSLNWHARNFKKKQFITSSDGTKMVFYSGYNAKLSEYNLKVWDFTKDSLYSVGSGSFNKLGFLKKGEILAFFTADGANRKNKLYTLKIFDFKLSNYQTVKNVKPYRKNPSFLKNRDNNTIVFSVIDSNLASEPILYLMDFEHPIQPFYKVSEFESILFSEDSKKLIFISHYNSNQKEGILNVWNLESRNFELQEKIKYEFGINYKLSIDGKKIAYFSTSSTKKETATLQLKYLNEEKQDSFKNVCTSRTSYHFSKDSNLFSFVVDKKKPTLYIKNLAKPKPTFIDSIGSVPYMGSRKSFRYLISKDGNYIGYETAYNDNYIGTLKIKDISQDKLVKSFPIYCNPSQYMWDSTDFVITTEAVDQIVFLTKDSSRFNKNIETIKIWDKVEDSLFIYNLDELEYFITKKGKEVIFFSASKNYHSSTLKVWNAFQNQAIEIPNVSKVWGIHLSQNHKNMVFVKNHDSATNTGDLFVWNFSTFDSLIFHKVSWSFWAYGHSPFSDDGNKIIIPRNKGSIYEIWDLKTKTKIREIKHHNPIHAFQFINKDTHIATMSPSPFSSYHILKISKILPSHELIPDYNKMMYLLSEEEKNKIKF